MTTLMEVTMQPDDLEQMIDDNYEERGWNKKTGITTNVKLKTLGLENMSNGSVSHF